MFPLNDALDYILLGGFLFGLLFTVASLLLGFADIGAEHQLEHAADHGSEHGAFHGLVNISAILAFITWTGGVGYLAKNGLGIWGWLAVLIGIAGGLVGAAIIAVFFAKVLRAGDQVMDPADWDQHGLLAHVTSTIRPGGVGEIGYEANGLRQTAPAKSIGEREIARGTEVIMMRTERGVVEVQPFQELLEADDA